MQRWSFLGWLMLAGCASVQPMVPLLLPPDPYPVVPLVLPKEPEPIVAPVIEIGGDPLHIIDQANRAALIRPTAADFRRSIVVFPFKPGALYRVDTALQQPTDIVLQPGERLLKYASGEKRWQYDISEGIDPVHILLMPTRAKLRTRIALVTDRGVYYLAMHSHVNTGLTAVSWKHPPKAVPLETIVTAYSIGFGLTGGTGQSWTPVYVWDDGKHSYLLFGERMQSTQAPIVAIRHGDSRTLVNYRVQGRTYKIDRILDAGESFELRVNSDEAQVVLISRTLDARQIRCPGSEECGIIQRWTRRTYGTD